MSMIHRSRTAISVFVALYTVALSAPLVVHAEDQIITGEDQALAMAAVAGPSWDETSGYGAVEASRAMIGHPAASMTAEEIRALAAQQVMQTHDIGSMQEEALLAVVANGSSWDQTSGYGSVEASRAMIGHPAASTTAEANRVSAAQQALLSRDLGSLQEDALAAIVAASIAEADASIDDAVQLTYAQRLAQFRAVELSLGQSLGAEQRVSSGANES